MSKQRWLVVLVIAVVSCGCADDAATIHQRHAESQQEAVAQLQAAGGEAVKKQYPLGEAWVVTLSGAKLTEDTLASLKVLQRVSELNLSKSNVTDAELPRIVESSGGMLFKLNLSGTAVTDAGLPALANLVLLSELDLTGTRVTKDAVAQMNAIRKKDPKIMPQFKNTRAKL